MKAFKYFTTNDWEAYLGASLYDRLKEVYHTKKGVARAFQTPFNFQACKAVTGLHVSTGLHRRIGKREPKMKKVVCLIGALLIISGSVCIIPFFIISLFFGIRE